jgi:AraC family transcriptional regulator
MWNKANTDGTSENILKLSDRDPGGLLGICAECYDSGFDYWIAAATTKDCPPGLQKKEIPASTWAIFEITGPLPDAMQEVWMRMFAEWLPNSGYEHAQTAEIEWYSLGEPSSPEYKSEIWIPVIKN